MSTWLDKNRGVIFGLLAAAAVAGTGFFYFRQPAAPPPIEVATAPATATITPTPLPLPTATPAPVRVYITGAVAHEDVYILPAGSIIKELVQAAGGFTTEADYTRINLALELKDQQQIHVPRRNEANPPPPVQGGTSPTAVTAENAPANSPAAASGPINLNTATADQLDALPGVGPAIAKRIIAYRETTGKFTSCEEIKQVSGIGEATFAKIKDLITVQ